VIDMQQTILKRLRVEIDRLKNERTEIIANSKQNQIVQNRIQAAVISIIQATTFEKMIHVVTHELPELLDVDFITLAIEANADAPKRVPVRGVYVLAPGAIDAALGPSKHARLRSHIVGEEAFFGDVARFVKSDVLMRLRVSSGSPDGVMCFGSRDPEAFGPEMATELLFFLAKVLENTIRAWLDLPSDDQPRCRARGLARLAAERAAAVGQHLHRLRARRLGLPLFHDQIPRRAADACPAGQAEARRVPRLVGRAEPQGDGPQLDRAGLLLGALVLPLPRQARARAHASIAAIQTPKLPRSLPKALTERDMEDLLEAPAQPEREAWIERRDTAILLLLYAAGPAHRRGAGPPKGTVDGLLRRPRHARITGKGNKTRLVPLLPQALEALAPIATPARS
jgi:uncharacterized protein YigA (DUF484 family)